MAVDTPTSPTGAGPAPVAGPVPASKRIAALFPDPSAPRPSWWRRRRAAIAVALVVVLIVVGVVAAQAFGASDPSYVTATVATHDVASLYNGVGVVEPVSQATVAFPASGTVAAVDVKLGDSVTIGQALASLDPQALAQTLHEKQATLAQAELTLQKALDGESVGGIGTGSTGGSRSAGSTGASNASAAASTAGAGSTVVLTAMTIPHSGNPQIAKAQQDVLAAQHQVDGAVNTATQAVDSAATICAAAGVGTSTPTTPTAGQLTACQTAMKNVQTAQAAVTTAQQQLVAASTALDTLLGQEATTPATTPSTTPSRGSRTGSGTGGSGTTHASTGSGSGSSSPSAADLAAYQQAVDAAAADVAVAEQAIAQATVMSPIAGTVEAVNLAVGDTVSAGSTTANIVVVGAGGYEVTTTVSVDKIPDIKVGQPATFVPDGSKRPLSGTVASISLAPDTSASTTSYRVVVGLTDPEAPLDNGSTGAVAIVTKTARSALAVPTSAVTPVGTRHTVTVLDGGTATRTLVQVGVVGSGWTEITGGLKAGQKVVLANLDEPLPGAATSSSNGTNTNTNGAGGFRFGGAFPGGGGGGAFPGGFTRGGGRATP